jgi:CRISPR system Cascade subunit CasA
MTCRYSLLDEPLIRTRLTKDGSLAHYTLPGLFVALASDVVRDFPALRPHQRHPWHAFLVQLAAMAMHHAGQSEPFASEAEWKEALLALTPSHPDGEAWYLVAPHDKPAFMQAPVPGGSINGWGNDTPTPDLLDILVTSKNHDLKQGRISLAHPDDWVFTLVSIQTAAPFPGRGNYGVTRMNGGSSSRPGLGIDPPSGPGRRWLRDVRIALAGRASLVDDFKYAAAEGVGLLWLAPWDGKSAYTYASLDPFFIEICRRIRLVANGDQIKAIRTTSTGPRIAKGESKSRKGNTGDLWTPIEIAAGKSLGVSGTGFNYKRMVELLFGSNYKKPPAQIVGNEDDAEGLTVVARAIAGGQSTTDGYHERRIPISPKVRRRLIVRDTDELAATATQRVQDIAKMRGLLWTATATLFENGTVKDKFSDSAKDKANIFSKPFEQAEDARFFDELNAEIESDDPDKVRLGWYLSMAEHAEVILRNAFDAGPRSGEQRYRARAAALSRFHGGLRAGKVLPSLSQHYREQKASKENAHDHA